MDNELLDILVPIPTADEQQEQITNELQDEGFKISNFFSGGVFTTTIRIFIQIRIELLKLMRIVLPNMFVSYAENEWLDLKAPDYSKQRKQATKTQGILRLERTKKGDVIVIPKGYIFKTDADYSGKEYRFISVSGGINHNEIIGEVVIEAERPGVDYNVPSMSIVKSVVHIEGIDKIYNEDGWIKREGADREDDESFRDRILASWAELSTMPIRDKYKNVAESVEGVLYALVDDMHPRGQGTVDVIITSSKGEASQALLDEVETACNSIRGPYDHLLIKSAETVEQDVNLVLYLPKYSSDEGLVAKATEYVREYFKVTKNRNLNELYLSELIFYVRKNMDTLKGIKVIAPDQDLRLEKHKVIILGDINITIEKV